jgi:coenzyme F420-reducing hydrogenase delta subunit
MLLPRRAILALLPFSLAAAEPPASIQGTWEITRIIPTTNVQTAPDPQASGKRFTYTAESAELAGVRVEEPEYTLTTVEAADFAVDYRAPLSELGITADRVRLVTISRKSNPVAEMGATVVLAGRRRLVTVWDGVFYELRRPAKP